MFKKILKSILILLLLIFSFFSGAYFVQKDEFVKELAQKEVVFLGEVTGKYDEINDGIFSQDVDFDLFWEVWDALKRDYVDSGELNEKEMFYGAISGMVASIGDPYTVFMDPEIAQDFEDDLAGTFEGIGAEIGIRDEILTIVAPLDGMPAEKAGLKAGDKVYAIDGESTIGITSTEAVNKIRGPKDTDVVLTIFHEGADSTEDITITRGTIVVKSVTTELREDGIFIIEISNFNDDTLELFNQAVKESLSNDIKGIILDLRNNPGGYLDTAIEVSSEWVEEGPVVIEYFSDEKKEEYLARGRARLQDYKTVVLVNQGSASASEIVSGALRDYEKATIVGEKTYGKGSVQTLRDFSDGSSVKITVAKWLTPNGDCINHEGIEPNEEVELTLDDYKENKDPQMDRALEILLNE